MLFVIVVPTLNKGFLLLCSDKTFCGTFCVASVQVRSFLLSVDLQQLKKEIMMYVYDFLVFLINCTKLNDLIC